MKASFTPHYQGSPCKKCKGRVRYNSTDACVPCAKAAVRKSRGTPEPVSDPMVGIEPVVFKGVEIKWDDLL